MPEELRLQATYLNLAARVWGPQQGLPVLALHGWLDNAASFDGLAPLLPDCRLVALDLPGHGLSDWRPAGVHYHFVDFVPDVLMAADALGWDRFTLLGHSLGAAVACFVAATQPQRIQRLVLIESPGPLSGEPAQAPGQLAESMAQMQRLKGKRLPIYEGYEQAAKSRQLAGDLSYPAALTLAKRGLAPVDGGFVWRSDPSLKLKSPSYLTEEQVLAFLSAIRAPTLLIQAESGYWVHREILARRLQQLPQLCLKMLLGGHHLHLDDPEPVAAVIADFFSAVS